MHRCFAQVQNQAETLRSIHTGSLIPPSVRRTPAISEATYSKRGNGLAIGNRAVFEVLLKQSRCRNRLANSELKSNRGRGQISFIKIWNFLLQKNWAINLELPHQNGWQKQAET